LSFPPDANIFSSKDLSSKHTYDDDEVDDDDNARDVDDDDIR